MPKMSAVILVGLLGLSPAAPLPGAKAPSLPPTTETATAAPEGPSAPKPVDEAGRRDRGFADVQIAEVLRTLARQARVNLVVSALLVAEPTKVTLQLRDLTAFEALRAVCASQRLVLEQDASIYYVKHPRERLGDMQFLDSEYLAKALAEFRARQLKELLEGGLRRAEAIEVLKLDRILPAKLRTRAVPSRRLGYPSPPPVPKGAVEGPKQSAEFLDIGLAKVLTQLADEAGLNVILSKGVRDADATVVMRLEQITAREAFFIVCSSKDLSVRSEGKVLCVELPSERLLDRHYLDDDGLARSLARFRVNQIRELKARGFSAAEALGLARGNVPSAETLARRSGEN